MCSYPAGEIAPFDSLENFCEARAWVDTANTILSNLITDDKLYMMPRGDSRKLLRHTARLLDLASEKLASEDNSETEERSE
jgi:hypothetical protein